MERGDVGHRYKKQGQRTVFDALFEEKIRRRKTGFLGEIKDYLDFEMFRPLLEKTFTESQFGPRRYDCVLMWKIVMLQKWFAMSDPEAEEQIADRISFRQFLGLSLNDDIPDETTICLFRQHLEKTGVYEWLFEVLNKELSERRVKVKAGTLVDATFVQASNGKDRHGNKVDPDSDYGHKGHGYSIHVNVGATDKLIEELEVTSARPHDSQHLEDVLIGDETELWADSAYRSEETEKQLKAEGIQSQILEKAHRNRPLTEAQKALNREKSRVRCRVEHLFGHWKAHQGFGKTRYVGLANNRCDAFFHAIAYNFRRGLFLLKEQAKQVLETLKQQLPQEYCLQTT
jgi:transposase, IS5 family